ncbi:hypothetical protein [Kitasatospora sp. NPDC002522]
MDEEDRPAIPAGRLEDLFDGLRREVVLGVPVPPSAEVVRRGVRRRRRRVGAAAGAGVLGAAVLWSGLSVLPARGGHGVAGHPVPDSVAPLPLPTDGPSFPSVAPMPVVLDRVPGPLASAEAPVRSLVLDVSRLPSVLGAYGPWAVAADASPSAEAGSPSPGSGEVVTETAEPFAEGCVARLVRSVGAEQVWGEAYTDGGREEVTAHQFVLRFGSSQEAALVGGRLLAGGDCVAPSAGWVVEQQVGGVVALGVEVPVAAAEEVAVHVDGPLVAVLTVHRGGRGVWPGEGLSEPFRDAATEFLALGDSPAQ